VIVVENPIDLSSYRARESAVILGESSEGLVRVSQKELESGTYILGKQGSGKSFLLLSAILQQIEGGGAVFVVDPHGDLIKEVISRMPERRVSDTCLLDLQVAREYPFGMNIFALPRNGRGSVESREAVRNQCMQAFGKLWSETKSGLYFGKMLRHLVSLLLDCPELTLASVPLLFTDDEFRLRYTRRVQNPVSRAFWMGFNSWSVSKRERETQPLLDRIDRLLSDDVTRAVLCQQGAYLDLRQMVLERKIVLVNLHMREIAYSYPASVVGTFLVSLLHSATFGLADIPVDKRPGYSLFVDEFSNFGSDESYEQFFTEGRKYKVKQFLAHQYRSQLDREGSTTNKEATTSAYTIVCMSCNDSDANSMAGIFKGLPKQASNLYVDPVERLDTHPSPVVKEFVLRYLNGLRGGARLRIKTETVKEYDFYEEKEEKVKREVYPRYDFGFDYLAFDPDTCATLLASLNHLLYDAQKDGCFAEARLADWIESYGRLVGLIKSTRVEDEEYLSVKAENERVVAEKRQRRELAKQAYDLVDDRVRKQRAIIRDEEMELRSAERAYEKFLSQKDLLEQRIKELYWEALEGLNFTYQTNKRKHTKRIRSPHREFYGFWFSDEPDILSTTTRWTNVTKHAVSIKDDKILIVVNKEVWERYIQGIAEEDDAGTHYVYTPPKEELDIEGIYARHGFDLWVMSQEQKKAVEFSRGKLREWQESAGGEACQAETRLRQISLCDRQLTELKTSLENAKQAYEQVQALAVNERVQPKPLPEQYRTEWVVDPRLEAIQKLLRGVLEAVIAFPLTIDKSEYSPSEIADILQKLEQREALVKIGGRVRKMTTLDVNNAYPALDAQQVHGRTTAILHQTIHTYCRDRASVEREIEAVYAGDSGTLAYAQGFDEARDSRGAKAEPGRGQPASAKGTAGGIANARTRVDRTAGQGESELPFATMPTLEEISAWEVFDRNEY